MYTPPTCPILQRALADLTYDRPLVGTSRVLDVVVSSDGVAWVAMERTPGFRDRHARPLYVCVVGIDPRPGLILPWTYLRETGSLADARCPARILDQLSPPDWYLMPGESRADGPYEWATAWRERCRANLAVSA